MRTIVPTCNSSVLRHRLRLATSVFAVLFMGFICFGIPAQAGTYVMTSQTGGTFTMTPGPPFPINYGNGAAGYGAGGGSGGTVTCSGAITTVYTWQPSNTADTPPQNVIVNETCTASWKGYGYTLPTGSCDNGLGDADVDLGPMGDAPPAPIVSTSHSSTGIHYRVVQGQDTLTFTCNPSANASNPIYANCSVEYSINITPVVVNLSGITVVGNTKNILIGQGTTASLDSGRYDQSNWTWTISGDPFAGFVRTVTGPPNPSDTGHAVELTDVDTMWKLKRSVFYFYRSIGNKGVQPPPGQANQAQTVSCTVTLTDPNNPAAAPINLTPSTTVNVYQPDNSFTATTPGALNVYPHADDNTLWFQDSGLNVQGITWTGAVTSPAMFVSGEEIGAWNYTQLVQPRAGYKENGVVYADPNSNLTGLDGTFPYAGLYPANGNPGIAGDSPGLKVRTTMSVAQFKLQAWTWQLYQPPAYNGSEPTTWVPLHEVDWVVDGYTTYDAVNGWLVAATPAPKGITVTDKGPTSVLPDWTRVLKPITFVIVQ